jgi:RimJ/RimL family protein N-acetyltransferase
VDSVLVTERLAVRRFASTGADVENLLLLDGDQRVMRYLDGRLKGRGEIERDVLPGILDEYEQQPGFGTWGAETREDGRFIGWFCLRPVAPTPQPMVAWTGARTAKHTVMLGYRLRYDAWGRGYAAECARALVDRTFSSGAAVERIVATTMAVNVASRRVLEKAGLHCRRTVHLDWPDPLPGNEHGDVEYQITRAQWAAA